jgi:hypothetical protein
VKFKEHTHEITEMLKLAGIPNNPPERQRLSTAVGNAAETYDIAHRQWRVPRDAYDKVAKAARALIAAINALNRTYNYRAREDSWTENQHDAQAGVIRILNGAERGARAVRRGQPPKEDKLVVVSAAVEYLFMHSPELQQKHRLSNSHREFIELFYETVTDEYFLDENAHPRPTEKPNMRGTLDWQIKQAIKMMRTPKAPRGV